MSDPWIAAFAVLTIAVIVLGLIVLGVVRRSIVVLEDAEAALHTFMPGEPRGLTAGTPVPDFATDAVGAASFGLTDLRGERSIVLFLSPGCSPCHALVAEMRESSPALDRAQLVVVVEATPEGRRLADSLLARVVFEQGEVSRAFETVSTPHAFAVDERGVVVGAFVPNTTDQLVELSERVWEEGGDPRPETAVRSAADDAVLTK